MKLALAQLNFKIADFENNQKVIIEHIEKAKMDGADLIVFSELSICGYPPLDFLELRDFYDKCTSSLAAIAKACQGIAAIVGGPGLNQNPFGKKLYNTAWFVEDGVVKQAIHKTLLPTYDVFDEYRYFEPNGDFSIVECKGKRIALTICEDLWDDQPFQNPFGKAQLYTISPMDELAKQNPDLIINIAASPFSYTKEKIKKNIFTQKAAKHQLPLFYVNQVGANTELIFDGGSMVVGANGEILHELATFREDYQVYDLDEVTCGSKNYHLNPSKLDIEKIHDALILGIQDYFQKSGFSKATLGLSGGIDSAVTLVLAVEALGAENVRVVLMPSKYSSDHSIIDAIELAENLGVKFDIVSIQNICHQFDRALLPIFAGLGNDLTEENIQARTRGVLMMGLSNKLGFIVLNTSNKSEAAVGYGTLYGDMCGGISVLGDVYKTKVYDLAYYINRNQEIIPNNSIVKPPSAELRPGQKDSDSLPEYSELDPILELYIEEQLSEDEIVAAGHKFEVVKRVIQLVNRNEYKRFQTPPILRVTSKAFGMGRRMPIVGKY